jgi:hypothetical protein
VQKVCKKKAGPGKPVESQGNNLTELFVRFDPDRKIT